VKEQRQERRKADLQVPDKEVSDLVWVAHSSHHEQTGKGAVVVWLVLEHLQTDRERERENERESERREKRHTTEKVRNE